MEEESQLINEQHVYLGESYSSFEEMVKNVSKSLIDEGYVQESYPIAVIDREKKYPTGLETMSIPVGIPHTDREHVNKSVISVIRPNEPILFKEMGTGVKDVSAQLVFMLAIKEGKGQIEVLSKLMGIFADKDILQKIYDADSKEQIVSILHNVLK